MKIWYSSYQLKPQAVLNAHGPTSRQGAILKVEYSDGKVGYTDLAPMPEVGDLSLTDELKMLRENKRGTLGERSLEMAYLDAEARSEKRSLFANLEIPPSHYVVPTLDGFDFETVADDFHTLKIKLGHNLRKELPQLKKLVETFSLDRFLALRLDLNASLNYDQFVESFGPWILPYLELVEDPMPWDPKKWEIVNHELGFPLALDLEFKTTPDFRAPDDAFDFFVYKPALQGLEVVEAMVLREKRFFVTSYMDHPLGQMAAAYKAAELGDRYPHLMVECGLLTHKLFEPNEFSESLKVTANLLQPAAGTGLGFDDLLEDLVWKEL
jgi:O-succinylbenzoate synthase